MVDQFVFSFRLTWLILIHFTYFKTFDFQTLKGISIGVFHYKIYNVIIYAV